MDNQKPKLVLLDVDRTLFDRQRYRKFIQEKVLEKTGIDNSSEESIYKQTIFEKGVFDRDYYLNLLSSKISTNNSLDVLRQMLFDESILTNYLYADVSYFLEQISMTAKLGVLSMGDYNFQKSKLSSFQRLLESDKIYILPDKKKEAERITSENKEFQVYFIDDDPETLEIYKKSDPNWTTILIERYGPNDYNYVSDFEITSLQEGVEIINK